MSYGFTWTAAAPTVVATLPLGYADGVHRVALQRDGGPRRREAVPADRPRVHGPAHGRGAARGRASPAATRSSSSAAQGGETHLMDELAELAGTINYEMACAFGMRLERVYR